MLAEPVKQQDSEAGLVVIIGDGWRDVYLYDRYLSDAECKQREWCFAEKYGIPLPEGSHAGS